VDGFSINFTLVDMLEVLLAQKAGPRCDQCDETATDDGENEDVAVARCVTCDHWLCEFHRTSHKRSRDTKLHDIRTLQEVQEEPNLFRDVPMCAKHPTHKLDLFCLDCDEAVCTRCSILAPHQMHRREEISEAFTAFQEQMQAPLSEAQRVAAACAQGIQAVQRNIEGIHGRLAEEERRARQYFGELRDTLNQRETALHSELQACAQERIKALEQQKNELQFEHAYASSTCEESQRLLQQEDDVRVLQMKKHMKEHVHQITARFVEAAAVPCRPADFRFDAGDDDLRATLAEAGQVRQKADPKSEEQTEQRDNNSGGRSAATAPMFGFGSVTAASSPNLESGSSVEPATVRAAPVFSAADASLAKPTDVAPLGEFMPLSGWECDVCCVQNKENTVQCASCETPRPVPAATYAAPGASAVSTFSTPARLLDASAFGSPASASGSMSSGAFAGRAGSTGSALASTFGSSSSATTKKIAELKALLAAKTDAIRSHGGASSAAAFAATAPKTIAPSADDDPEMKARLERLKALDAMLLGGCHQSQ
jgi:hypothetical protein